MKPNLPVEDENEMNLTKLISALKGQMEIVDGATGNQTPPGIGPSPDRRDACLPLSAGPKEALRFYWTGAGRKPEASRVGAGRRRLEGLGVVSDYSRIARVSRDASPAHAVHAPRGHFVRHFPQQAVRRTVGLR